MAQAQPNIARPRLLGAALAGLALAAALAGVGFVNLYERLASDPVTILGGAERLGAALEKAPWVSAGRDGPIVWAVLGAPCEACAGFATRDLADIEADGYDVRVIFVAQAGAPRAEQDRAIAMARARLGAQGAPDPGEAEGALAWGRAAADEIDAVLRANGAAGGLPMLIWRRGPEWRVIVGRDPHARSRLAAELAPNA